MINHEIIDKEIELEEKNFQDFIEFLGFKYIGPDLIDALVPQWGYSKRKNTSTCRLVATIGKKHKLSLGTIPVSTTEAKIALATVSTWRRYRALLWYRENMRKRTTLEDFNLEEVNAKRKEAV